MEHAGASGHRMLQCRESGVFEGKKNKAKGREKIHTPVEVKPMEVGGCSSKASNPSATSRCRRLRWLFFFFDLLGIVSEQFQRTHSPDPTDASEKNDTQNKDATDGRLVQKSILSGQGKILRVRLIKVITVCA